MVSKVAVIALVAIVACPILLGYGMNLEQNTYTDYSETKDPIDVTPLLKNGEKYNVANADVYKLNTDITTVDGNPIIPLYKKGTAAQSTLPFSLGFVDWAGGGWGLSNLYRTFMFFDYDPNWGNITLNVYDGNNVWVNAIAGIIYYFYDKPTDSITYTRYDSNLEMIVEGYISGGNYSAVNVAYGGFVTVPTYYGTQHENNNTGFVDLSAGFRLNSGLTNPIINLPENTKSYIITIDLDSVTEPDYNLTISDNYLDFHMFKRTNNGVVTWSTDMGGTQQIYYDSSRNDNTYQYYVSLVERYESGDRTYTKTHVELNYVGSWPTLIGAARSFLTYENDYTRSQPTMNVTDYGFDTIRVMPDSYYSSVMTPTIRMDAATFMAFQYPIIKDKVYDPGAFKTNPATKITDIGQYGSYLTFGGNTYFVNDGNITLGTHDLPVRKLVFSSTPISGGYENKIGDILISITPLPSTLTFGGEWGANVVTDSMASTTYTKTDWTPGDFAWNGLDQNFLMIGLLAALGVFIALGIAYRRVKSALFALLVVCGGAVLLFFTML